jgi:hypothetical protein
MAKLCREGAHCLTPKERQFVASMARWRKPPTDRQLAWLVSIYERLLEQRERAA